MVLPALVFWRWTRELPAFDSLRDYRPLVTTRVFAADGQEAFAFARERRTVVPLAEVPDVLKKAVLAAEDAKFYQHEGVNYLAILRCAVKGLVRGGVSCGGSTITQQVVKTFLLADEWRPKRKVQELVLAPRLEQNLGKDDVLWLYLNQIYLGHRRYGVEEASRYYFGKPVAKLTLGEAATLAGVVQSPERLSPVKHPAAAKERQRYVLRRMAEEGFITRARGRRRGGPPDRRGAAPGQPERRLLRRRGPAAPRRPLRRRGGGDRTGSPSRSAWTPRSSGPPRRRCRPTSARSTGARAGAGRSSSSRRRSSPPRCRPGASGWPTHASRAARRWPGTSPGWTPTRSSRATPRPTCAGSSASARSSRGRPTARW